MKTTHDDGTTAESRLSFGLLPVELQVHVLGFVPPLDVLLNASLVCREWRDLAACDAVWRAVHQHTFGGPPPDDLDDLDGNLFDDDELEGGLELEEESKSEERWRKLTLSILTCMQRKWRKTWREVGQAVHEEWLAWAIQQGHVCIVLPLLRERSASDLERMPHELMASAGRAGSLGLLALLHPHISVDAADSRAMAALHYACLNGHAEAVRWLLQHGAEVNQVNEIGKTPLMFAAEGGHDQVVRVLLEHGADPLATTREDLKSDLYSHHRQDLTALHFAARSGSVETARALVRAGADACTASHRMSVRPQDGRTPLEIAAAKGDVPLVELLLDLLATSVHPAAAKEDAVRKSLAAATAKGHTNVLVLLASNNQPDQSSQ